MNRSAEPRRILLIRRDNIGDLVLVTPFIHALRARFPAAWIGVLGNSYNTPVLAGSPDIDQLFAYDKAKHRPERARLAVYADTARLMLRLRAMRIDLVILAGPGAQHHAARLARWIRPTAVLGFVVAGAPRNVTLAVPYGAGAALHEAEDVYRLGAPLGIAGAPGPCVLAADAKARVYLAQAMDAAGRDGRRVVAVHISARRPRQRWAVERFAALMRSLAARHRAFFLLLWSPGSEEDPRHPGDDAKARAIMDALRQEVACLAWPTQSLRDLAAGLAECALMICADGGAMHLAAGLGVPVVALFGDSPAHRWHPWGVRHEVLQAPGGDVAEIAMSVVADAAGRLLAAP